MHSTDQKMPTGDANPTAGCTDTSTVQNPANTDKVFDSLREDSALNGHAPYCTHLQDGTATFWAERWGLLPHLATIDKARQFLEQIGGRL